MVVVAGHNVMLLQLGLRSTIFEDWKNGVNQGVNCFVYSDVLRNATKLAALIGAGHIN